MVYIKYASIIYYIQDMKASIYPKIHMKVFLQQMN